MATEDAAARDKDAEVAGWAGPTGTDPGPEDDQTGTGKGATLDAGDDGGTATGKGVTADAAD